MGIAHLNEIKIPVVLELYKQGKIGFKRAWLMSGLSFPNFAHLLNEHEIDPHIPLRKSDEE